MPQQTALSSRERVARTLNLEEADRIPRMDSFWPETIPGWEKQGLAPGTDLWDLFEYDIMMAGWVDQSARIGVNELVEETNEWRTAKDGNGAILKYWRNKSGTPEHVAYTVDNRDTWLEYKADLLAAPIERRVDAQAVLNTMAQARQSGRWFTWGGVECFENAKDILGHEQLCCAMASEPDWAKDVFDTEAEIAVRALDYLEKCGAEFDGGWLYGDVAYNHGPFCSPRMYRQLVQPAHKRHMDWFHNRGLPVIYHTDGDFRPLLEQLIESGVNCFQPLEAKANIDVRELKPQYGKSVAFMGNINAMVLLTNDREQIEEEIGSKLTAAKVGGGYIYHSDHSVPPGVNWDTYQFVMEMVQKYGSY